jgi:hypothetical protein
MVAINAAVPRNQIRSTAASDSAGRNVVNRSVRPPSMTLLDGVFPDRIARPLTVRAGVLGDRAAGPSRVVRRARNSIGIAARMTSAEMTMIA